MWAGSILMLLFVAAFPIYRLYEPAERTAAEETQTMFLAAQGEEIYQTDCRDCHGDNGRGGIGPAIGSREFLETVDDEAIGQLIALGIPGTQMVAYSINHGGPMTSEEIEAIVTFLRSLEEDAESNPGWHTPLAAENLSGQELYSLACSNCHGADRGGIEDDAPAIGPGSFALDESDEWLAERITNGKNEMPRFGGVLNSEQINLIIAFLRGVDPSQVGATTTTTTTSSETGDTTPEEDDGADAGLLEIGEEIFNVTAGGVGCASCHGSDAGGTGDGPNIIGSSKSAITRAMAGVTDMDNINLTGDQLEAVYQYLRTLSP
jgi:mono/diheme cytochrome c family protein